MWKFLSRATTRTVSSRPGSGMMGSAQTEHLGAYCLEGSKAVHVRMWGGASVLSPEHRKSRQWWHGNRQTSLPIFPTSQGREKPHPPQTHYHQVLTPSHSSCRKHTQRSPGGPIPGPLTLVHPPPCRCLCPTAGRYRDMKPWPPKVES